MSSGFTSSTADDFDILYLLIQHEILLFSRVTRHQRVTGEVFFSWDRQKDLFEIVTFELRLKCQGEAEA